MRIPAADIKKMFFENMVALVDGTRDPAEKCYHKVTTAQSATKSNRFSLCLRVFVVRSWVFGRVSS